MFILFSCYFDQTLQTKAVFASYYLTLSLPMFLTCFLIFANWPKFQPHISYRHPQGRKANSEAPGQKRKSMPSASEVSR